MSNPVEDMALALEPFAKGWNETYGVDDPSDWPKHIPTMPAVNTAPIMCLVLEDFRRAASALSAYRDGEKKGVPTEQAEPGRSERPQEASPEGLQEALRIAVCNAVDDWRASDAFDEDGEAMGLNDLLALVKEKTIKEALKRCESLKDFICGEISQVLKDVLPDPPKGQDAGNEEARIGRMGDRAIRSAIAHVSRTGLPLTPNAADPITDPTEPGMGRRLSDAAREKIMEIDRENMRNASNLHSLILASLSHPFQEQDR